MSRPRIALGGIIHETHSFAATPTTLADFAGNLLYRGDDILTRLRGSRAGLGGMIDAGERLGWTLLPTLYASAMPGGIVTANAYETMLADLLTRLEAALPLDGLLLALHGAMVTETELDAESHLLRAVRQLVGWDLPIVVELDMHGNIGLDTLGCADILVAFDTNPHIDAYERGVEAAEILARLLRKEIEPTITRVPLPFLLAPQATGTDDQPLRAVHERAAQMEAEPEVVCICVMAGFAYGDTPATGPGVIVTTNDRPDLAESYASELANILRTGYELLPPSRSVSPEAAVAAALALPGGPIILVDSADNIGGGTPGDGTDGLRAMLALEVDEGCIVLADPAAAAACHAAGVSAKLTLKVGGKADDWHGQPITVTGVVQALSDGEFDCELADNHFAAFYGRRIAMGPSAWLRVDGVNILLTTRKTPPFDLGQLRHIGIKPEAQKMIVVKSAVAYRAAYLPIAAGVIEMDTAGLCTADLSRFPYRHWQFGGQRRHPPKIS